MDRIAAALEGSGEVVACLPSRRADGDWGDLRIAVAALAAYAPQVPLLVCWEGPTEPDHLAPHPNLSLVERPPGIGTASEAWNHAVGLARQWGAVDVILTADDVVVVPDSVERLLGDTAQVRDRFGAQSVGMVAARSNYVKGPQNIRSGNGGVLSTNMMRWSTEDEVFAIDMAVPVFACVSIDAFTSVGGMPATNWFGDDLFCFDLVASGRQNFVSRAYVHHVGERGTGSQDALLRAGVQFLVDHRRDFIEAKRLEGLVEQVLGASVLTGAKR
ncbi:MAG: hypothetical protein R2770_09630 [Acidimicrobiales bacterium]